MLKYTISGSFYPDKEKAAFNGFYLSCWNCHFADKLRIEVRSSSVVGFLGFRFRFGGCVGGFLLGDLLCVNLLVGAVDAFYYQNMQVRLTMN